MPILEVDNAAIVSFGDAKAMTEQIVQNL